MRLNLSTSNAGIAGEFVLFLFNVRTSTHIMHLNTRSHAAHLALDDFYKGIVDLADRFAEAAIGNFSTITWPATLTEGLRISPDPAGYIRQVRNGVQKAIELIHQEDLKNILTETLELTNTTIYKLENLS